jgi:transposase
MVADSALYTAENLKQMQDWKWLTRVPFRLKPAQALARQIKSSEMIPSMGRRISLLNSHTNLWRN